MKINTKKITSLAVATMIAVGSTSAFAVDFKDVKGHWAIKHIEKVQKLGFIQGFEDGTFKPEQSITRIQTISLVSRFLNLSVSEVDKAESKHKAVLLANKVPEWAIRDLSVALSEGIIDTNILNKLIDKKGAQTLSQREEVTIYLARALKLQKEVESQGSNIVLPFKDSAKITAEAKPYVFTMNQYNIINGDTNGNFNPKSAIKRSEMATLLSISYDNLDKIGKKKDDEVKPQPKPEPKPEVENLKAISGTMRGVFTANDNTYIAIETSPGKEETFNIDSKTVLRMDGNIVNSSQLSEQLKVKAEVATSKDGKTVFIRTLDVESKYETYNGVIFNISDLSIKSFNLEYKENGIIKKQFLIMSSDAEIIIDGQRANFSDLRDKDTLSVKVKNGKVVQIDAISNIRDIEGVLKNVDINLKQIQIENKDGNRAIYELHKNVDIVRDNRGVNLSDLKKGDKVKIHVEEKVVTKLNAEIVRSTIEGKLVRKIIDYNKGEITVSNYKTSRDETYSIPYNTIIELDGKRSKLDDFELGYDVKIDLEGEEVAYVRGQATVLNKKHLGKIISIGREYLEMRTQDGKISKVKFTDARIKDSSGAPISDRDLKEGHEILVTGDMYINEINATEVMKISN